MKKRLSIFLLICGILISSIVGIEGVWADVYSSYEEGSSGQISACTDSDSGGIHCYSGTVGVRITLVNKNTGKRCKYSNNNGELKILCSEDDTSGTDTKSVDYWFDAQSLGVFKDQAWCYTYSSKKTKQEFIQSYTDSNIKSSVSCTGNVSTKSISELSNQLRIYRYTKKQSNGTVYDYYSLDTNGNGKWDSTDQKLDWASCSNDENKKTGVGCLIEPVRNPKNMTYINNWLNSQQTGKNINRTVFNRIIANSLGVESVNVQTLAGMDDVSFQFDQLLEVVNYNNTAFGLSGFAAIGTVAEASYLYTQQDNSNYYNYSKYEDAADRWCTTQSTTGWANGIDNKSSAKDCGSSMASGGYFTGWKSDSIYPGATDSKNNYDYTLNISGSNAIDNVAANTDNYISLDLQQLYTRKDTTNVFRFVLSDELTGGCNADAVDILTTKGYLEGYTTKQYEDSNGKKYKYLVGGTLKEGYLDELKASEDIVEDCFDDNGNLDTTNCYQLSENYIKHVGVSLNTDLCKPRDCNDTVNEINKYYNYTDTAYKSVIEYLYKTNYNNEFAKDGLIYDVWFDIQRNHASCGYTPPPCEPSGDTEVHCLNPTINEFTLSDSDDVQNCILNGIAYNDVENAGDDMDYIQTSNDFEYGTSEDPGTCKESVRFNFPTSVYDIPAGTIFKWGIDTSKENNVFGTMTVTRVCYVSDSVKKDNSREFTSKWADVGNSSGARINPDIYIRYAQAIPTEVGDDKSIMADLSVQLSKFNINAFGSDNLSRSAYITAGSRTYKCNNAEANNGCSNLERIEMVATYDIIYGDSLNWYSDKSNNASTVSADKFFDNDSLDNYVSIGYGLPTQFVTPSNYHCEGATYGTKTSGETKKSNGALYVEAADIGTKNSDGSYHFDDYLLFALTDDDDLNPNASIVYNCEYTVNNKLFDNENGSGSGYCITDRVPKGLDVVFRTIELINVNNTGAYEQLGELNQAFPGRAGEGRPRGENWSKYEETGTTIVEQTISKILSTEVYNREPMYTIVLDVSLIQRIRRYNDAMRDNGKDPYTNMEVENANGNGYANEANGFSGYVFYKKDDGDTTYAYSAFLYHLVNSCTNSEGEPCLQVSSTNPCIKGNGVHVPACNQSWWDDSDPNQGPTDDEEETTE